MVHGPAIAIVGRGCVLPGAFDPGQLWQAVARGDVLLSTQDGRRGGYVQGFEEIFDATGFQIPIDQIKRLDRLFHFTLHGVRQALADAGGPAEVRRRTGLVMGNLSFPSEALVRYAQSVWLERQPQLALDEAALARVRSARPAPVSRFMSGSPAHVAARALGLGRRAFAIDAACASGLYAVHLACEELRAGRADAMVAGAVSCSDRLFMHLSSLALGALSPTGRSRPFHREADGLLPAEGAAFVVLRRLEDAVAAGERVLAVIRGIGLSNDGRGRALLAPDEDGQVRAMQLAYREAEIDPRSISLIECHGTGTKVGDATELRSLARVFCDAENVPIGSLKSNLGHLITAAGIAGLIKTVEALNAGLRPPTLHAEEPAEPLRRSPLRLLQQQEAWTCVGPRRAAISAFGFGGNNAHLILEQHLPQERATRAGQRQPAPDTRPIPGASVAVVALEASLGSRDPGDAGNDLPSLASALLGAGGPAGDGFEARSARLEQVNLAAEGLRFPPRALEQTLPQQLLVFELARKACQSVAALPRERTGVFVGIQCDAEVGRYSFREQLQQLRGELGLSDPDWPEQARAAVGPPLTSEAVVGTMPNMPANRISSQLDLVGPSYTVSSEELSGVDALRIAIAAIERGALDAAIVAAVDLCCEPVHEAAARDFLPPHLHRAADAAVLLVLKRLDIAQSEGNPVLALVADSPDTGQGATSADSADLQLGSTPGAVSLTPVLGHAHAASGLLHVAAAVLACRHRVRPAPSGRGAEPWLPVEICRAEVTVVTEGAAASGIERRISVTEHLATVSTGYPGLGRPEIHVYAGRDREQVLQRLRAGQPCTEGPARLALVAVGADEARSRHRQAAEVLAGRIPAPDGVYFRETPLSGDTAFVFTGAAAAYAGMGRDLLLAFPSLTQRLQGWLPELPEMAGWIYRGDEATRQPLEQLFGCSFLCQVHAELMRQVKLTPQAVIGYSSGESNALFAAGVWQDARQMYADMKDSPLFAREIAGEFSAIRRHWRKSGVPAEGRWANFALQADPADVRAAIGAEARVHLEIVSSPEDVVIGGEADACARVIEALGCAAFPLGYEMAVHCPELAEVAEPWLALHRRKTTARAGLAVYSGATGAAYRPDEETTAQAFLGQAIAPLDFVRLIRNAYRDGVRVFVEHGPRGLCSDWIRKTLAAEGVPAGSYLAVSLDRPGRLSVQHTARAIAQLVVHGLPLDLGPFCPVASERTALATSALRLAAHPPPVVLPRPADQSLVRMEPPPPLALPFHMRQQATVVERARRPVHRSPARATGIGSRLTEGHAAYLAGQHAAQIAFIGLRDGLAQAVLQTATAPLRRPMPRPARRPEPQPSRRGPKFSRADLEELASGRISSIFGPVFQGQDGYERQVRMPEPPFLLADRVTGIDAEPRSMGLGKIWTETDVRPDSWYLHDGYMPFGIMIEAGQADLLLISWLGVDFLNRGKRVYRLLGCEVTYHGGPARPGETLAFEIQVDGHASQGDVRLFFMHYQCTVGGKPRLTVNKGQAGFFTDRELEDSAGLRWNPGEVDLSSVGPNDPAEVPRVPTSLTREQVLALASGRVRDGMGPGFEWTETHVRTPRIPSGDLLLLGAITQLDLTGGVLSRGYMRAVTDIRPDDWFFKGHFKSDPCMPGTLMFEGCLQAMAVYLTALGYTLKRDGWRFEPVPDVPYPLRCRGQVSPRSRQLVYELFVRRVTGGDLPTLQADVLCTVDGRKAFLAEALQLRLVPDWPLTSQSDLVERHRPTTLAPIAAAGGIRFDHRAMMAGAVGRPSEAFGAIYRRFDGPPRVARLPGPPYLFMSRCTRLQGDIGSMKSGAEVEVDYEIPPDAWYFDANGFPTMPLAVLMEAALQPCGWLACYLGGALTADEELYFRNLDGVGTLTSELVPASGVLSTRVTITNISRFAGNIIESFDVECRIGGEVVFTMQTAFGFFPKKALENQVGLPTTAEQKLSVEAPSDFLVDLRARPEPYFSGSLRLADARLLMIDRITGFWATAGAAGLGRLRGEKDVRPSEWFFKAHFFQDPVQPGSLGVEALVQLLQAFAIRSGLGRDIPSPRFEPIALGRTLTWKYRGQVTPESKLITTEIEVCSIERSDREVCLVAEGSLWVDGRRIYSTQGLSVRIVPGAAAPGPAPREAAPADESNAADVLDVGADPWLGDHCPTFTMPAVPMMTVLDRLAAAAVAARPDKVVTGLEDVRLHRWLTLAAPLPLRTEVQPVAGPRTGAVKVTLSAFRVAARAELSRFEPVATGIVLLDSAYPAPAGPGLPALRDPQPAPDPYASGALFHGPSFRLLRKLVMGRNGSSSVLDAGAGSVPRGLLHQALLDAATHGIPHDALEQWAPELGDGAIGFPQTVPSATFYRRLPDTGEVRCEVRFAGLEGDRHARFDVELVDDEGPLLRLRLVEVLMPRGGIGRVPRVHRQAFLRDGRWIPGLALSAVQGEAAVFTDRDLAESNWLPGTVQSAYATDAQAGSSLLSEVAIKDHVAARLSVHPRQVRVTADGTAARVPALPCTQLPLSVRDLGGGISVTSAGEPLFDVTRVREHWTRILGDGLAGDLYYGLMEKFVRRVVLSDPAAFEELSGRPCLYLCNHQVGIESVLFSMITTGLLGVTATTIAKVEHQVSWLGWLIRHCLSYPGVVDPGVISFFDRSRADSLPAVLSSLLSGDRDDGRSVIVHVEGTRALSCRKPVSALSSVLIDGALASDRPIVPVRFAGGLPVNPLSARLEYPVGFGRQDYLIGAPLLPGVLRALPYKTRREAVLRAINAVGPPWEDEQPLEADPAFERAVASWHERTGVAPEYACVLQALMRLCRPSQQTRRFLNTLDGRPGHGPADSETNRWLAQIAERLLGPNGPRPAPR